MLHSEPQPTTLFRSSLRDWQARWKARKAAETETAATPATAAAPPGAPPAEPRVKRLVAHRRRRQKRLAASQE